MIQYLTAKKNSNLINHFIVRSIDFSFSIAQKKNTPYIWGYIIIIMSYYYQLWVFLWWLLMKSKSKGKPCVCLFFRHHDDDDQDMNMMIMMMKGENSIRKKNSCLIYLPCACVCLCVSYPYFCHYLFIWSDEKIIQDENINVQTSFGHWLMSKLHVENICLSQFIYINQIQKIHHRLLIISLIEWESKFDHHHHRHHYFRFCMIFKSKKKMTEIYLDKKVESKSI